MYCTQDGAIVGFRKDVNPTTGIIAFSSTSAGYTGLTLSWASLTTGTAATSGTSFEHRLYAANFRQETVDVFHYSTTLKKFEAVTLTGSDAFTDLTPPTPPEGTTWSPFNVEHLDFVVTTSPKHQALYHWILVAYAAHTTGTAGNPMDDVPAVGNGYVNLFTAEGAFVTRFVDAYTVLDSPWGIAVAHSPYPFGKQRLPMATLVGNHGNGEINVYPFEPVVDAKTHLPTVTTVTSQGTLNDDQPMPLAFDGLCALHFGPKTYSKAELTAYLKTPSDLIEDDTNLYFSAGIVNEGHGLVGKIISP